MYFVKYATSIESFNQIFGTIHSTEGSPDTDQDCKSEPYFKNDQHVEDMQHTQEEEQRRQQQ